MSSYRFECWYCGHKFTKYLYSTESLEGLCCPKCKDTRLREESTNAESKDAFGYTYDENTGKKRK